jgi:hypothetical protein
MAPFTGRVSERSANRSLATDARFLATKPGDTGAKRPSLADFVGEPAGTRTQDPVIKSHVLYRLSYGLGAPLLTEKL